MLRTQPACESFPPSVLWTPDDYAAQFTEKPLVSSRGTVHWEGIVVERTRLAPQERYLAASTHHLLALGLGTQYHLWRRMGEDIQEGFHVCGSTMVIARGQSRLSRWSRTADVLLIHVAPQLLERAAETLLADLDRIEIMNAFSVPDPQIEHIGKALLAELEQGIPGGRLFGETLATALALHLLHKYNAFPAVRSPVADKLSRSELRCAIEYIHDNLGEDLSLHKIANVVGVSTNYFVSLFKQATGQSPHQYVIQQRVEKAKALLAQGHLSVCEIAVLVGFYDSAHLTRHFKRLTGTTPRAVHKAVSVE
jgi:AraC family transcriptional regulator